MPRVNASALLSLLVASTITLKCDFASASGDDATVMINDAISKGWLEHAVTPSKRCSDRTFVRRVYLDLAGRVPTTTEVITFVKDSRDRKRERLIDALLASEDHAQHFADLFDALLMGRVDESKYDDRIKHGWRAYLENVFRNNRPWDEVASEILLARPREDHQRGAVWFLYERDNQHQAIAESVAPAFFGIRIECAQCHDHLMVDEIRQEHYWGLVAFFNRGKNKHTSAGPRIAESAIGGFSEFADLSGDSSPNLLSFVGVDPIDEARPGKDEKQTDADELYVAADAKDEPRVPKFSRRQQFVENVLRNHPLLSRAMVNRVWAILMGRGIVHPYDEIDSMHPPSHPELLDWLANDFSDNGFDVRRLIRSIALSSAYQLRSVRPDAAAAPETFAWYLERPLTAEQFARSVQLVLRGSFQNDSQVLKSLRQQFVDVLPKQVESSIGDALFMSNGESLSRFISQSNQDGHLIKRLKDRRSDIDRADLLIETIFGRLPKPQESKALAAYLGQRRDRLDDALAQSAWALISSAEFRFNH